MKTQKPIEDKRYGFKVIVDGGSAGTVPIDDKQQVKELVEKLYKQEYTLNRVRLIEHD